MRVLHPDSLTSLETPAAGLPAILADRSPRQMSQSWLVIGSAQIRNIIAKFKQQYSCQGGDGSGSRGESGLSTKSNSMIRF